MWFQLPRRESEACENSKLKNPNQFKAYLMFITFIVSKVISLYTGSLHGPGELTLFV